VAYNKANVNSTLDGYLIDLSVYDITKTQNIDAKISKSKLSRSQACSGLISSIKNNG
jgi:hypothetical protein